ncbi:hypothetical protein SDC9_146411 [bioreactor metagenome]|uniref:Uncharacterized protein n=1 Tax=bioreactor metagenome TaxID=1076179 RepID=A0A645EBK5_9ZZZZ
MAVSNIEGRNFIKGLLDGFDGAVFVDNPNGVPNAVFRCEVIFRSFRGPFIHQSGNFCFLRVSQEDGSGIGVGGIHVADPVSFLGFPGEFMLLDPVFHVVIHGSSSDNSRFLNITHDQAIDIEIRLGIPDEGSFFQELVDVGFCLGVDLIIILIHLTRQVNFSFVHMQE